MPSDCSSFDAEQPRRRGVALFGCRDLRDKRGFEQRKEEAAMISWAITFFIISLIAAVLGLRGVAGLSAEMGYLFAVLAVVFLVIALLTGHSVAPVS
jgi:uncharacterized membrane protein YtjA (UPF0391 family)